MCKRELVIDADSHGLESLAVGVLRLAVRNGFIPHHEWVLDVAHIVSTGTAPNPGRLFDQGEVIDDAVSYLSSRVFDSEGVGEGCEAPDHYVIEDNSLYRVNCCECDDPISCDTYAG